MKTYEEWKQERLPENILPDVFYDEADYHIAVNWAERGWQACAAEYQPQLTELRRLLQEVLEMYPQTYSCEPGAFEMTHINPEDWKDVRSKIEDVLDRSGARGGSVAASPAPLPDNPPTNTDRSRT